MSKAFFPKLALINIKKNSRTYVPYILSCIGTILTYYILTALSLDEGLGKIAGGGSMKMILELGTGVIAIFAVIFLFYTNSFLIKRRKKEFGLLNILGMEKKHLSWVMFFETLYVGIFSFVMGIGLGFVLSKLIKLILLKLADMGVQFGFPFSIVAAGHSALLFGVIFLICFFNTLRQIHMTKPIDLLKGGSKGEREPKAKWIVTLLGILFLGIGYYIAITTEDPISALLLFFVAVILVILGTNLLFISGSISLLKLLRNRKSYYYKAGHFISVSGMFYRMKQNAVGLANICILSTMVLVIVSSTVALYAGMDNILRNRFERNIIIENFETSEESTEELEALIAKQCGSVEVEPENVLTYRSKDLELYYKEGIFTKENVEGSRNSFLTLVPLSEYNEMMGERTVLNENQILLQCADEKDQKSFEDGKIFIAGHDYSVLKQVENIDADYWQRIVLDGFTVVMEDEETILALYEELSGRQEPELSYKYAFDVPGAANQLAAYAAIQLGLQNWEGPEGFGISCAENSRGNFLGLYGGLLFIGIFLGLLFVMATVLIIYYKQISEGYEDAERFEIMQKVGMSMGEVRKSIRSQVLIVFFLPLITAGIHITFAFPIITRLLAVLNLTNVRLFGFTTICVFLMFALFYCLVYLLTARVYYKIVRRE